MYIYIYICTRIFVPPLRGGPRFLLDRGHTLETQKDNATYTNCNPSSQQDSKYVALKLSLSLCLPLSLSLSHLLSLCMRRHIRINSHTLCNKHLPMSRIGYVGQGGCLMLACVTFYVWRLNLFIGFLTCVSCVETCILCVSSCIVDVWPHGWMGERTSGQTHGTPLRNARVPRIGFQAYQHLGDFAAIRN